MSNQSCILTLEAALNAIDEICAAVESDTELNETEEPRRLPQNQKPPADAVTFADCHAQSLFLKSPRPLHVEIEDPLNKHNDAEFLRIYRFPKNAVQNILEMIAYGLTKHDNRGHPVSPIKQLLTTLKFLANGDQKRLGNKQISSPTVSRIIRNVTTLLSHLKSRFISIPERSKQKSNADKFHQVAGFPEVVGCVGATPIAIRCPGKAVAHHYLNSKGFHSFQVMMICGPANEFLEIISRWPGGTHENQIFNISELQQRLQFQQMEGVLLADNNYMPSGFVMTPLSLANSQSEVKFNEAHHKTYNVPAVVELWKRRFKCLQTVLQNKEETIQSIIGATAVLHNYALQLKIPLPPEVRHESIAKIKSKEGFKDNMQVHIPTMMVQPLMGSMDRQYFIDKHFKA